MKNFIMITLGTGVGSGIIIDGKLVYGHDGFAGELGHVTAIRNNGRLCGCGKSGCSGIATGSASEAAKLNAGMSNRMLAFIRVRMRAIV
jgi:glucokinase